MDWKRIFRAILFPPLWLVLLLALLSAPLLVLVFVNKAESHPLAPAVYALSFYALTAVCLACWKTLPPRWQRIKDRLYTGKYTGRYLTDAAFKTYVGLYRSLTVNAFYVAVNAVSAIAYRTHWFGLFAVYHAILALMRFLLVRRAGQLQHRTHQLRRARLCACLLLSVNLALSGAVLMMLYFHRGFRYPGVLIYVVALYTFYITTTAIIDLIRYRKYKSPVLSMSKVIKMAAALFSMLSLETAMLSQFGGDMTQESQHLLIMATGGGISIVVVSMAVYMIVCTTREIRSLK